MRVHDHAHVVTMRAAMHTSRPCTRHHQATLVTVDGSAGQPYTYTRVLMTGLRALRLVV